MTVNRDNVLRLMKDGNLIVQSYIHSSAQYGKKPDWMPSWVAPYLKFMYKNRRWRLAKSLIVELSTADNMLLRFGFEFDMATVPSILWGVFPPYNDAIFAYVLHDYLYINRASHQLTRKQCDKELLYWANLTNANKLDNYFRYLIVRLFGSLWWNN